MITTHLTDDGQYGDPLTTNRNIAIQCLLATPTETMSEDQINSMFAELSKVLTPLSKIDQRLVVIDLYFKFASIMDEPTQNLFNSAIVQTIKTGTDAHILKLTEKYSIERKSFKDLSIFLDAIHIKIVEYIKNEELRKAYYDLVNNLGTHEKIVTIVKHFWADDTFGVLLLDEVKDVIRAEEFRDLITDLLSATTNLTDDKMNSRFSAIGGYGEKYTVQYVEKLTSLLINDLIKSAMIGVRRGATMIWDGIKERAPQKEQVRFYQRVIEYIKDRINDDTIDQPLNIILVEVMTLNIGHVDKDIKDSFLNIILRTMEEGKPININQFGHGVIKKLITEEISVRKLISTVIKNLESAGEQARIINCLTTLKETKHLLNEANLKRISTFIEDRSTEEYIQGFTDIIQHSENK